MKNVMLSVLVASIGLSGVSTASEKASGSDLLEKRCSVCHPSERAKSEKMNKAQWEATVKRMVEKGAKLSSDEKKTLIDYLSKSYKL